MFHLCFSLFYLWCAKLLSFYETANNISFIFTKRQKTVRYNKKKVSIYKETPKKIVLLHLE